MVWLEPIVRVMALSQSVPTANTQEPSRVVVTDPVGAPEVALNMAVAPTAPEPLLPLESTPAKATTVIEEAALCAKLALIVALLKTAGAKARQISASPNTPFARAANCHVNPAPVTEVTVFPPEVLESLEMNASSSSFDPVVENCAVEDWLFAEEESADETVSIVRIDGFPDELTVRVALAECVSAPLVPVTVTEYVPAGVVLEASIVSCAVPEPVTVCGAKLAVAPAGSPLTVRVVADEYPFCAVIVVA